MKKSSILLTNAIVLSMDSNLNIYEPGAVAISSNIIQAVGYESEICAAYSADQVIDIKGKLIMPGLINAHTHVPMALLRGLADDLRLDVWLMGYMMPVERQFVSPDFVNLGTLLACAEMIRSGVTCFADMYYFEETVAKATVQAGLRAVCSQTVLKFPAPDANSYDDSLAAAREFISRWKGHPLIIPSIAPHSAYTCTEQILRETTSLAVEFDVPLHTHFSETLGEVENIRKEKGMPVIPFVKKCGLFDAKVLGAHCVHVDEGEIRTMQHYNAGVAHNPSSNLKLASGIAPVQKMLDIGLNVGIGTDGPASNNDLDMFEEIRLASFLAKGSSGDPTALPADKTLLMATHMGAQALHIGDITGSLEAGKRADLILVNLNQLHNSPRFKRDNRNLYGQIVYSCKSTDVTDVMVNGKWVMQDQHILTLDEEYLLKYCEDYAKKIDVFLINREKSVLSKLIAIGGATEEESFEVQIKVPITDFQPILSALQNPEIVIVRKRHYQEYDTYFSFDDIDQGYLRFREDHFVDTDDKITTVRARLTHIGKAVEKQLPRSVILSRSRFLAPAQQGLRFYREYFNPKFENDIEKERFRFLVKYKDTDFFVNLDSIRKPSLGKFLEVKSRTWSQKDAEIKAKMAAELVMLLGITSIDATTSDYISLLTGKQN